MAWSTECWEFLKLSGPVGLKPGLIANIENIFNQTLYYRRWFMHTCKETCRWVCERLCVSVCVWECVCFCVCVFVLLCVWECVCFYVCVLLCARGKVRPPPYIWPVTRWQANVWLWAFPGLPSNWFSTGNTDASMRPILPSLTISKHAS